jgi:hypothetical protein
MKFYSAFFSAAFVIGLTGLAPSAHAAPASCVLEVGGQPFINRPCTFELLTGDAGSFKIMDMVGDYFAYVYVEGDAATAHWNETAGVDRAHTPLGALQRDGACWTSDTVRICATAAEKSYGVSPLGSWDCEIMSFSLDEDTYKNSSAAAAPVRSIEKFAGNAYGVTLVDGYRFSLFEVTSDRLIWHSPASSDTFDCRRE